MQKTNLEGVYNKKEFQSFLDQLKPYNKPNSCLLYTIYTLKSLCRSREQLIKERSKFEVLLTNELDRAFPKIKHFFNNMISTRSFLNNNTINDL